MERITISVDNQMAADIDAWAKAHFYANRSEAIRDLIRAQLQQEQIEQSHASPALACLSYLFHHQERAPGERLLSLQNAHHDLIVSTVYCALDGERRFESCLLRGSMNELQRFAQLVCAERGVHHGKLNLILE